MKQHFNVKIFFAIAIFGLIPECKADTVDNYQIYIGKTLKLTEASFSPLRSTLPFLHLDTSNHFDSININFHHCTFGASGRQLKLTDTGDNTIIVWEFGNIDEKPLMSIPIIDILTNSAINANSSYKLYYVDKEYPTYRLLTSVFVGQLDVKKSNVSLLRFDKTFLFFTLGGLIVIFLIYKFSRQIGPNR